MAGAWRKLHKYLGLSMGALLLLVCLSGGILVFKESVIAFCLKLAPQSPEYNVHQLSQNLGEIVAGHTPENIFYLKTPTQGRSYWLLVTHDEQMYVYDGYSAAFVSDSWNILPALHWLTHFHTELLIPTSGTTLLTLLGIFTLILILAGFISWWPGRRGFRWRHLWLAPSRRGPALRQHRAWAIFCIPLLLLSVVTGGGMSVQSSLRYLLAKPAPEPAVEDRLISDVKPLNQDRIEAFLKQAQAQLPGSELTLIGLPSRERNSLRLRFRAADEWHVNGKTNVSIDALTGEMTIKGLEGASVGRRILNTFYPLHSSFGLNPGYVMIIALTAVLSVWLAVLGFMAWFKRRVA